MVPVCRKEALKRRSEGSKAHRLSLEEERKYIAEAQAGSREAVTKLMVSIDRILWKMIHNYANDRVSREDLFGYAAIGALDAIYKFDLSKSNRFITYASWYILQAVQQAMGSNAIIKVPRLQGETQDIVRQLMREQPEATEASILAQTNKNRTGPCRPRVTYAYRPVLSYNADMRGKRGNTYRVVAGIPAKECTYKKTQERRTTLAKLLLFLSYRELVVITASLESRNMQSVYQELGVCRSRCGQIRKTALRKMRRVAQKLGLEYD